MIQLHISVEEADLIRRVLLNECIECLSWLKKTSSGPDKTSMQHHLDRIQIAIIHVTKAIELNGAINGKSTTDNI